MRVLTADQMRAADAAAVERIGDATLMRNAGIAIADVVRAIAPKARRIVAFAGPGNNGGDAFAALAEIGGPAQRIVYAMPARDPSIGRRDAQRRALSAGVIARPFPLGAEEAAAALEGADVALDALLGTGAHAALSPIFESAVRALNATSAHVVAIDLPTGIDATSGEASPHAVRANTTVALGAAKLGTLLDPARADCGDIFVGDIDLGSDVADLGEPFFAALDAIEFAALLPARAHATDKRGAGAPFVVAGSERFPGAAVLCARGAARAGAGYVTVACPNSAAPTLRAHLVEQVVVTYDDANPAAAIDALLEAAKHSTSVAIGPGLERSEAMTAIVRGFLARNDLPAVIDASALAMIELEALRDKPCVLTPHETEFSRLPGEGPIPPGRRVERLRAFVRRSGIVTLLKGNTTLIDDGTTMHLNVTGTSALATAGTGDVLSGIVATLLSQRCSPVDAARVGAYWHGLAGRHAAQLRPVGVVAGDVYDALGSVVTRPRQISPRVRALL